MKREWRRLERQFSAVTGPEDCRGQDRVVFGKGEEVPVVDDEVLCIGYSKRGKP